MRSIALALFGLILATAPAFAQQAAQKSEAMGSADAGSSMGKLLSQGYEIRAAVPNGTRYIVFLQKDQSAYACEFVSLTKSRCGSIN
ncbi:hypothetical protein ADU59_08005 [Pararhizobium polonicum]|jgi:hypothetical protein|uniref:Uncharacterized protein n=1 Tax=Pararhizobium polonicum TaxID=1612624 RepID=A0A1C7P4T8_9HYPH|nr:hypothetical protein [Pararhizobium polonicum]OBZ96278.1 hypothetical protein ADU59_08005 [Pararhizobium polonicum]